MDDLLVEDGQTAPFNPTETSYAAMGRFGNVCLVSGEPDPVLEVRAGEVLSLALIAAVYIGFAVADGRARVIAVESTVAGGFVVLAAVGVTGPAWLLVLGFAGHGVKDLWQHRRQFVANTRWWPPFCLVIDSVAAAILVVLITVGVDFHP